MDIIARARVTYGELIAEVTTPDTFPDAVSEVTANVRRLFREAMCDVAAFDALEAEPEAE